MIILILLIFIQNFQNWATFVATKKLFMNFPNNKTFVTRCEVFWKYKILHKLGSITKSPVLDDTKLPILIMRKTIAFSAYLISEKKVQLKLFLW